MVCRAFSNSNIGRELIRSHRETNGRVDRSSSFSSYNKTENLTVDELSAFDYLLVEASSDEDPNLRSYLARNFQILDFVRGYNGFYLDKQFLLRMRHIPKVYLLEKRKI